ncbi:MAG: hypothetical protein IT168_20725 [Bryobacterales bacterium]|nr:hypothetical protein [Bryobacterales bacterium]
MLSAGDAAAAQPLADLTLTLTVKQNRTRFRMGEQIDLQLRFQTTAQGRYRVFSTGMDRRYVRDPEYDRFTAESSPGARDPLFDSGTLVGGGMGRPPFQSALGPEALIVDGILNDWVSFSKPGAYRVRAESARVFRAGAKPEPVKLVSNWVAIEIVAPEPGWQEQQLKTALAALGPTEDNRDPEPVLRAARTLRFLETVEAVPHLVRLFENGPQAAQQDLRAGLLASPHRPEVIAAMEQAIDAPGFPVTLYWLGTLMQIEYARRFGPRGEPMPQNDSQALKRWMEEDRRYMERFKPIQEQYNAKLAQAVPRKRGRARAVSLEALFSEAAPAIRSEVRSLLVAEFANLPQEVQWRLLMAWPAIGGPDLEPGLTVVAAKTGRAQDAAIEHLMELNPAAARRIVIDRIKHGDLGDPRGPAPYEFMFLDDGRLPELEDALIPMVETNGFAGALLGRYASDAALPRIGPFLNRNPRAMCSGGVAAYLFRVDPAYASRLLAEARKAQPSCPLTFATGAIALLMSPGMERAAIDDLTHADPSVRRAALSLLKGGGSPAAEQALWEGFARLGRQSAAPLDFGLDQGYVDALIQGCGWVLKPEHLDQVERLCPTPNCRQFAHSQRRFLDRPIEIAIHSQGPWMVTVGGCFTFTPEHARQRISRFSPGTPFRLPPGPGPGWFYTQRIAALKKMLTDAGMTIQD